jgi:hypothetical protein
MLCGTAGRNFAQAVTAPGTWSNLGQLNPNTQTYDTALNVSYKFMGGTPDTTFTAPSTGSNADAQRWTVQVFRGVDPTTPLDVAAVAASGVGTGRPDPGSITPTTSGAYVLICGGGAAATGAAYTAPANYTTNFLTGTTADTNDAMVGSGYRAWTSGAENPAQYTGGTTNAVDSWAAYTIALRPQVAVTHATTGTLVGSGSTVAGSANHKTLHGTTGALVGQGSTVTGSANRSTPVTHATTGVLVGQGSTIVGAAARTRVHPTTGVLVGQGSTVVGAANRFRAHPTTGALVGQGATITGTADRAIGSVTHGTTGVLVGQGSTVTGAANRFRAHPSTGTLVGSGSTITGAAARTRVHPTTGALVGPGAVVAGTALRFRAHNATGALIGQGSKIGRAHV